MQPVTYEQKQHSVMAFITCEYVQAFDVNIAYKCTCCVGLLITPGVVLCTVCVYRTRDFIESILHGHVKPLYVRVHVPVNRS